MTDLLSAVKKIVVVVLIFFALVLFFILKVQPEPEVYTPVVPLKEIPLRNEANFFGGKG